MNVAVLGSGRWGRNVVRTFFELGDISAQFRSGARPVRLVRDGVLSCCCKGRPEEEGKYLLTAMSEVEIGSAVGRVTPALGRLPLAFAVNRAYAAAEGYAVDMLECDYLLGYLYAHEGDRMRATGTFQQTLALAVGLGNRHYAAFSERALDALRMGDPVSLAR